MIKIKGFAIILIIGLLAACSAPADGPRKGSVSSIQPEGDVLTAAKEKGFDYLGNVRRAEKGEIDATVALINFSTQTDAAASLAHGWVLLDLQQMMGTDKFASALARATGIGRKNALEYMDVAKTYKEDENKGQGRRGGKGGKEDRVGSQGHIAQNGFEFDPETDWLAGFR
jgi:hypothetical protein